MIVLVTRPVCTQAELDYETEISYELGVLAVDRGDPQKSATSTVHVHVVDANDNPPVFAQRRYRASVNEGASPGTSIIALLISDLDTEAATEVDYFITSGDPKGQFRVNSEGKFSVGGRSLDREKDSEYSLEVTATDGTFVAHCVVDIVVTDDNDNPPVCDR